MNDNHDRHSGKALLHLTEGDTCRLTFLAGSEQPGAVIQARLEKAGGACLEYWTADPVAVNASKREYTLEYNHTRSDIQDMRLAFPFKGGDNTICFHRVALKTARADSRTTSN